MNALTNRKKEKSLALLPHMVAGMAVLLDVPGDEMEAWFCTLTAKESDAVAAGSVPKPEPQTIKEKVIQSKSQTLCLRNYPGVSQRSIFSGQQFFNRKLWPENARENRRNCNFYGNVVWAANSQLDVFIHQFKAFWKVAFRIPGMIKEILGQALNATDGLRVLRRFHLGIQVISGAEYCSGYIKVKNCLPIRFRAKTIRILTWIRIILKPFRRNIDCCVDQIGIDEFNRSRRIEIDQRPDLSIFQIHSGHSRIQDRYVDQAFREINVNKTNLSHRNFGSTNIRTIKEEINSNNYWNLIQKCRASHVDRKKTNIFEINFVEICKIEVTSPYQHIFKARLVHLSIDKTGIRESEVFELGAIKLHEIEFTIRNNFTSTFIVTESCRSNYCWSRAFGIVGQYYRGLAKLRSQTRTEEAALKSETHEWLLDFRDQGLKGITFPAGVGPTLRKNLPSRGYALVLQRLPGQVDALQSSKQSVNSGYDGNKFKNNNREPEPRPVKQSTKLCFAKKCLPDTKCTSQFSIYSTGNYVNAVLGLCAFFNVNIPFFDVAIPVQNQYLTNIPIEHKVCEIHVPAAGPNYNSRIHAYFSALFLCAA